MPATIEPSSPPASRFSAIKLAVVLIVAGVFVGLTLAHVKGVNGPWYWTWPWRRLNAWPLYPLMALAAVPFFAAQWAYGRWPQHARWLLLLLMLATFCLELAAISQQRMGLGRIGALVENSVNTSYYTAAKVFVHQQERGVTTSEWLELYPELLQFMQVHAKYKPPGLVLYYVAIIRLFGEEGFGQMMGGLIIGAAATLTVAGTYFLIRRLGKDERAAWCGASFMAMCPSLVLFLPQFDQIYPAIACGMVLLWVESLERQSLRLAIAFGVLLMIATFMSYILLIMGLFMAVYSILYCGRTGVAGLNRTATYGVVALSVVALIYVLLWLATGFDPIATLKSANLLQEKYLVPLMRPFPGHIPWDLYDFALGSGWMSFALVLMALPNVRALPLPARRLIGLALLQIGIFAAAAFLPGESARLWMLLYPMLMVPVGFELARWPTSHRMAVYAALWLATAAIAQNMIFLNMGEGRH